ncbi:MAG: GFA family protein [Oscillospiraceae bacterium]|nr:GFA family protein [Oscillospiraceae bacterium]
MKNILGHCACGAVEVNIREYGNFVYACHCDDCRRRGGGAHMAVDPGNSSNVDFIKGKSNITIWIDEPIERGFCSICGCDIFWHNPADDHYCMNAELFDDIIKDASFELELFYDHKPAYYSFSGKRKRLDREFKEIPEQE